MSSTAPVFIVGTPRSGTTLLARILGRHPSLFMPGETHFFPDIYARRAELGDPPSAEGALAMKERLSTLYGRYNEPADQARVARIFSDAGHDAKLLQACSDGYREALDYFMDVQVAEAGKQRWGNNAPRDLFHVEEILRFYPDARVVCCVRDVRDFLLSYRGKWRVTSAQNVDRLKQLYHPVVTSLLWKASMKRVLRLRRTLPVSQFMVMRYEDLVQEPERSVMNVCRLIDVDYAPDLLEVDSNNSSERLQRSGIFSDSVGRWRSKLSAEEAAVGQQVAGSDLARLGYAKDVLDASPVRIAQFYASAPFHAWKALRANAAITGPLAPYLARRVTALWR